MDVTIITPVGPYHHDVVRRAAASVQAQTLPCAHTILYDDDRRGPAALRNEGLRRADTDFIVFLDADDWLHPDFARRCINAWRPYHYVYTDWYEGDRHKPAPACAWVNQTWHVITTLIPTATARYVGGFDETKPGGEDTDFYLKLRRAHFCGIRLPEPLFYYGAEGPRAAAFVHGPQFNDVMAELSRRYTHGVLR
jgi:hypothetical protein